MSGTIARSFAGTGHDKTTPSTGYSERKAIAKGLRVLIVEDHDASRQCLEGVLRKEGYSVCSCPSAEDGFARLEADHFDILLTDLHLPGVDGFGLIAKTKAVQPSVHVLMLTATPIEDVRERAVAAGVDALMAKPLELDQLLAFLDSIRLHIETGS
jgi:CheY-like chemotaxis protein